MKIVNNELIINITDLLRSLTPEEKRLLADSLSCEDSVIEDVTSQIITGWTVASSHGGLALDKAVREVAMRSGEVAERHIRHLEANNQYLKSRYDRLMAWAEDARRVMVQSHYNHSDCPFPSDYA